MKAKAIERVLDAVAADFVPEGVDLWPKILASASAEKKKGAQSWRARPALLVLIIVLALALFSGVVYAIGRSLGYIPGVGLVDDRQAVRVLREKVSVSQQGLTLQVKNVIVDSSQTLVEYRITGIPWPPEEMLQQCLQAPTLRLPDDSTLRSLQPWMKDGGGGENGVFTVEARWIFPSLPTDVNEVTLLAPCGSLSASLRLIPASQGQIRPATEWPATFDASRPSLPTALPTWTPGAAPAYPPDFPLTPTPVSAGSGLYLEKAIDLETSYLLMGHFTDAGDLPAGVTSARNRIPYDFRVQDSNGKPVVFSIRPDLMPDSPWGNVTYWAIEIWKPVEAPITITLPVVDLSLEGHFSFPLDVGSQPVQGQVWPIQKRVTIGNHDFLIEQISLARRGYELHFRTLQPMERPDLFCVFNVAEYQAKELVERFYDRKEYLEWSEMIVFDNPLPTGTMTFALDCDLFVPVGPWTLTWSPPGR